MKSPTAKRLPSGNWRAQVTVKGVHYSVTKETKKEAEKAALLLKLSPQKKAKAITYRQAIDDYLHKYEKELSPSTYKGYKDIQRTRFRSIMDLPISADIDFQRIINREDVSLKTLKNSYSLICAVLRDLGIEPQKVRYPKEAKKERPFLNTDQIKQFCRAIRGDQYELPYLLCLHSLRRSEMLALKKEQVKDGVIHVSGAIVRGEDGFIYKETNKTAASVRDIPIFIPRTKELIDASPDGFLCPYSVPSMDKHLRKILKSEGLPIGGFHLLRHSFASLCYAAGDGVSELTAMKLGGWSEFRTMRQIYTHLAEQQEKADVAKLTAALSDL